MLLKHNKKRNVGLLNEFFARYMAKAIIEHRDSDLRMAKELFSKHFQAGSTLHRELKLFRTLFETRLHSREAAYSLIEQVKQACKMQSQTKLDLEKTALLHEINLLLGGQTFFDQAIQEYRDHATIQVLLNHWRGGILTEHLGEAAQLEDKLLTQLTQKGTVYEKKEILKMTNEDVDGLVVNIMTEKLNRKFSAALNENQKKLLQLYVFSKDSPEAKASLTNLLEGIRSKVIANIDRALKVDGEAQKVGQKLQEIRSMMDTDYADISSLDDKAVTFYMTVCKLDEDLNNE